MTKHFRLTVGKYYIVDIGEVSRYARGDTCYGKLMEVIPHPPWKYKGVKQKYFIEFTKQFYGLHEGLNQSKKVGKKGRCYYVTRASILKEVTEGEILAKEL